MQAMGQFLRKVTPALAALSLSSCSGQVYKAAYNNADTLLMHRLGRYFELEDTQRDFVEKRLRHHHQVHRTKELPDYAVFLQTLRMKARDGLSPADVDWLWSETRDKRTRFMTALVPDTTAFLMTLTPEQLAHWEDRYYERLDKRLKEARESTPEERLEERVEETVENTERVVGALSDTQKARITALCAEVPDDPAFWIGLRRQRQGQLFTLLRQQPPRAELEASIARWLGREDDPVSKARSEQWTAASKRLLLGIDAMLTPEQRQTGLRYLEGLVKDINALTDA